MRRNLALWMGGLASTALGLMPMTAQAADHLDGPKVKLDHSTDINDVYAWMAPDKGKVYLAMTVFPQADAMSKFSTSAKYVFHLQSGATYGATTVSNVNVIATFTADQKVSLWVANAADNKVLDYVTGDASAEAGIPSSSGKTKVFTGRRLDPFFFNLEGFLDTAKFIGMNAAVLTATTDDAGCPTTVTPDLSTLLVTKLKSKANCMPPGMACSPGVDFFRDLQTLAIVVSVDTALVSPGGKVLGVWGSTNK